MNTKLERRWSGLAVRVSLFILCMLLFGAGTAGALGQAKTDPSPNAKNGQEAIDSLGVKLPQVAGAYGLTADELKILFLTDPTLYVDSNGELFYADEPFPEDLAASVAMQPGMDAAPFDPSQTFLLHSLPGASHVIYLDFDGHTTVAGTSWNGGASIVSPPYDIDGDPNTFNATEIERIQISWQIVSEDYSPYDIDVTTEDPGSAALSYQGSGDIYYGSRVVVTDDTWANCGCGGHAYIGSFDDYLDEPVFVYNQSLAGVAEATSHEVGHALLLSHDGTSTATYYTGHGSGEIGWAPIMGASYYQPVTQWSKGEYYDANNGGASANYGNGPDDLAILASLTNGNGFGYRPDDHGDVRLTATPLTLNGSAISGAGIIEQTDDVDVFSFTTGSGQVNLSIVGATPLPNLDVLAQLFDSTDTLVASSDSASQVSASMSVVLDEGTYYLHVDGTGTGAPLNAGPTGYTQYGSLGQYTISGTVVDPQTSAKYVILLIGDGMGPEQVKAANFYNGGPLVFEGLPYVADVTTYSASSSVTDSAAAATAMATGRKVNNGVISMAYPGSGAEIETILELFKAQGRSVGLVSTTYMSHATPAGFGAHDPDRNNLSNIANDYLTQTQPHVLFGGGANGMSSAAAAGAGYTVVTDRSSMQSLDTESATMVSGQFGSSHLPYEFDGSYSTLPHLNEMATTALAILDNNSTNGFFLMIEGGRIDHAGHDNEIERNVQESLEFSNTVQKVIDWVENSSNDSSWANTLMVITADHETGGLTVTQNNGSGNYPTVTWSTTGHTGVNVPIYAKGTGADQLSGLTVDNTDVYHVLLQDFVPGAVDVQISQSSDDVEEVALDGSVDLTSSDIELGDDPGFNEDQTEGLRFQNVTIPAGATITTAYLEFETDEADTGTTMVSIWAQASDDAPTFTSTTNDVTSRAKTAASVSWDIPAWNTADEHHQSPELKDVVQEVVDRAGWNSGNSMAFVISGTGSRTAESFDGEPAASAQLHIEYIGGPPNSPPQFNSDPVVENDATKSVLYGSTVADDAYDPDGDPLTFLKISGPSWLSVASSGALSGTPSEGDVGLNSWTVEVNDGNGGTEQAQLEITVRSDGGTVYVRIVQSDDDVEELVPSGTMDLTSTDIELGDDPGNNEDQTGGLRFQNVYLPQGAAITAAYLVFETDEPDTVETVVSIWAQASDDAPAFSSALHDVTSRATTTASVPWDIPPWNTVNELHQSPDLTALVQEVVDRPGWSAGSSLVFVISGTGSRTSESFNGEPAAAALLRVEYDLVAPNSPPAFDTDPVVEIAGIEDAAYNSTLADDASDPDSDPLTFTKISGPPWLTIASDGALSGLPANADVGLNSWNVEVSDGKDGADQATLEITVANVNDTPVFTSDPIVESSAAEDSAYSGSIADAASDPDVGDALTISKEGGPAWLVVSSDGALSGTPDNDDVGLNGFSVKVTDIAGASDTAVLQITVVNTNDPPTFPVDPLVESDATEDAPYNGSIAGDAADPDAGDTLTFSKESGPAWLTVDSDGLLSGTPFNSDVGVNDFSVIVSDAAGAFDTATLRITVFNTNDPPGFLVDPVVAASATEGMPYTGTIADDASDPDVGDTLTFSKESGPSWLAVAADGTLSGMPGSGDLGQNNFQVMVTDGVGASDTAAMQITVLNTNDPPAFTSDPIIEASAAEDTPYNSTLADDATDPDAGDTLTFSKQSGPAWLAVASDGALSGTPLDGDVGLNSFTVDVSDDNGGSDQAELQIFVVDTNDPPTVYAGSDDAITLPAEATLDGTVNDDGLPAPPNLVSTWTVVSGPGSVNFANVHAVDTMASFTSAGTYVLRLTAGDGEFDVSAEVSITVNVPLSDSPYLAFGKVNGVGDSWTEVTLPRTYNSTVVVASANVKNGDPPAVVRIQNASGNSFEVRVDGAGGGSPSDVTVHYMVVEEGAYNFADHGVTMEAVKYVSTVTDDDDSWLGESQSYANSYTNPVVLGQVMSYADANFSVFWSMGSGVAQPPSNSALTVGKHVGEDPDTTRADETIGYVVIEAGNGSIEGIEYAAGLGADSVQGMTNNPPYSYAISGLPAASTAIVSQAAMDASDGGWAHLFGANPVSATNLDLVIDEDQLHDSERNHSPEQVAYLVFEDPVVNQPPTAGFTYVATDLNVAFTDTSTDIDGTIGQWSWDFGDGNNSILQNPNNAFAAAGTYSVELTVIDDDGAIDSTTRSVTVTVANVPPTAGFTHVSTNLSAAFTDASTDGDGTVDQWSWDFGDGDNSTQENPNHSYAAAGTYSVELTVTDDDGAIDSTTQSVTVTAANVPPTAGFTHVATNLSAAFTDTSTDGDGTIDQWSWDFGDGNSSTLQHPNHAYAAAGTYIVEMIVTDDDGAIDSTTQSVTVTAANVPPTASFTHVATNLSAAFTDASTDGDGTIDQWSWDFGDGSNSTLQNPTHAYAAAGTYNVELTVTDDDATTDSTTQSVSVTAANVPPTASFTYVATDLSAAFTDASTDGDGTVDQWSWDFGDGSNSTQQNPTHAYTAAGTYSVFLTVTDDDGATDSTTQSVTVTAANEPPTVHFTYIAIVLNAAFTDTSTDGDGTADQWSWDSGDGNNSTQQNPTHAYTAIGTYSVLLTVTDDDGATDNSTQSVTLADTPNVDVIYVSSSTGTLLAALVSQMRISWPTTPSADSGQCILTARMWD